MFDNEELLYPEDVNLSIVGGMRVLVWCTGMKILFSLVNLTRVIIGSNQLSGLLAIALYLYPILNWLKDMLYSE